MCGLTGDDTAHPGSETNLNIYAILPRIRICDFDVDSRRLHARRPKVETAGTAILSQRRLADADPVWSFISGKSI